jgi:hypothetical protein
MARPPQFFKDQRVQFLDPECLCGTCVTTGTVMQKDPRKREYLVLLDNDNLVVWVPENHIQLMS